MLRLFCRAAGRNEAWLSRRARETHSCRKRRILCQYVFVLYTIVLDVIVLDVFVLYVFVPYVFVPCVFVLDDIRSRLWIYAVSVAAGKTPPAKARSPTQRDRRAELLA